MPDPIADAVAEAKAEFEAAMTAAGARAEKLREEMAPILADAEKAAVAGDYEAVKNLGTEVPVVLAESFIDTREEYRARFRALAGVVFRLSYSLAIRRAAPVLFLVLLLAGCAGMKRGTVPAEPLRGNVGALCRYDAACVALGTTEGAQTACDALLGTDATKGLLTDKWPQAATLAPHVDALCADPGGSVLACAAQRGDSPGFPVSMLTRSCARLERVLGKAGG